MLIQPGKYSYRREVTNIIRKNRKRQPIFFPCCIVPSHQPHGASKPKWFPPLSFERKEQLGLIRILIKSRCSTEEKGTRAVMLSDARAALQDISSSEAPVSVDILNIHLALSQLFENHNEVASQCIPAH
ncbi:hypothetical protein TNIN_69091 [Trichonephila inaurata madagascariensis]|uniref:Uncharacterized protein n=1 Tax=Trichonephila inaurata madagascariensis TaxID=2747483 RepID=A0A8X6MI72_9ARAC|nr:hypothetical protein TNIN_69091 [Trichonephila inaurata madagascariensis]